MALTLLKHTAHLLKIGHSLARHDALFWAEEARISPLLVTLGKIFKGNKSKGLTQGQRLAAALQEMGPTFIKLGQVLATRADLIGEDIAKDMATLQDRLSPFPFSEAKAIIEAEFNTPLLTLYAFFEEKPVAAASIAQVHRARTPDGRDVAVKVIRPLVKQQFAKDIALFDYVAARIHEKYPQTHRLKLPQVVAMFRQTIQLEMDLRMEAAAADEMAGYFAGDVTYHIPTLDWQRTSEKVLTLEWLDGIRIDDVSALRRCGHNPDAVLEKSAHGLFRQVFQHGFFHADVHPGNMLVLHDGRVALLDFGITGRLDKKTRLYLAEMLQGFLSAKYERVAEIHVEAGLVPPNTNVALFAQACRSIGQPILHLPWHEISVGRLLGQLFSIAEQFQMTVQPQLLLLQKTIVTAEGVGRSLNPTVNMWELTRPLVNAWVKEHYGIRAKIHETQEMWRETIGKIPFLIQELERKTRAPFSPQLPARARKNTGTTLLFFLMGVGLGVSYPFIYALLRTVL